MGLISPVQASDGVTAVNAASVNNPINTIAAEFNGNIDNANIKSGAAIDFSKIASGSSTALGAWQSWSPTFANWTIGTGGSAGTTATFVQIGKTVRFRIKSTLGTAGQSVGTNATFTLPVTANTAYGATNFPIGQLYDSGNFWGLIVLNSTTVAQLIYGVATGTNVQATGTTVATPFAWAAGSYFQASGEYEAA